MRPIRIDRATGALLRAVGAGRRLALDTGALTLRFRRAGGDGLILSARTGDGPVRLWVDAARWCRWIEPVLSVPDWDAVPVELRGALAAWTCACIEPDLASFGIAWLHADAIECGACPAEPAWSLGIEREHASLDMRVVDAPLAWLERLADRLDPLQPDSPRDSLPGSPPDSRAAAPAIRLALAAGWSSVDTATLARVRPGDALLLQHAYAAADGELALFADRPLATVLGCRSRPYTIGTTMDTFDDWLDIDVDVAPSVALDTPDAPDAPDSPDAGPLRLDAHVRVVAQVATIDVPLARLASLRAGDVLDGPAQPDGLVTLQVAGKPFARGTLLDVGGRLAVRIEHLLPA
ncbi:type III secretion system cytoplasmic ring protein SctQ [Burkholderia oklahomensis]|uniref:Type III secretion apparatus protein, YscQ/HrcQ family n=1 Tax=Burkholderia oklahomensis TaxID=342113 RepID=A0AAI8FRH7_9BURK|nr:type III secretion system cytoplasmic ring protein SctQ [Burkholderia oklahomensis]AIO69957.1 type III secretion apparatus protein, YscQ/HrcQ family [Burkholderia oklahomensis]AOI39193.1 translocation protein in type III secretion [Burkholderia oklahomensis EO147]KUY51682.1 translocation protein in type III secretion [Burkholderia oklahomensis EO147]QPS40455.1 type III secretion system cytoplasmic ring protein SctQ [Burkholderia oklahomensis]